MELPKEPKVIYSALKPVDKKRGCFCIKVVSVITEKERGWIQVDQYKTENIQVGPKSPNIQVAHVFVFCLHLIST